jgi:hypothetical protein
MSRTLKEVESCYGCILNPQCQIKFELEAFLKKHSHPINNGSTGHNSEKFTKLLANLCDARKESK